MLCATSLNVLFDYTDDIPRAVSRLALAGFEALDFNGCDMMQPWAGPDGDRHVETLAAAAEREGLPFVQAHGPMFDYFGEQAAAGVAETRRCIAWCGRLGVPWMVMHPYPLPGGFDREHRRRCLELNRNFLHQFVPDMERHGVGLAIENLSDHFGAGRRFGSVPEDLIDLHEVLDHERFGLCWDTGHAQLQQLPQTESIASLGARLKVLHIQDNSGKRDDHILPFCGTVDWGQVVSGLHGAGYHGHFTFEVHNAVRRLPDELRDDALRLTANIGKWFVGQIAGPP